MRAPKEKSKPKEKYFFHIHTGDTKGKIRGPIPIDRLVVELGGNNSITINMGRDLDTLQPKIKGLILYNGVEIHIEGDEVGIANIKTITVNSPINVYGRKY